MLSGCRYLAIVVCLAIGPAAAVAQETGGGFLLAEPRTELAPVTFGALSPDALRDSLSFTAHAKRFMPAVKMLPRWSSADSIAAPSFGYRSLGRIAPASAVPQFGHNPYAYDFRQGRGEVELLLEVRSAPRCRHLCHGRARR